MMLSNYKSYLMNKIKNWNKNQNIKSFYLRDSIRIKFFQKLNLKKK
jgi:hypothetical protein